LPNWFQIVDDGVNRVFNYSYNGIDFIQLGTSTRTDWMTPDQFAWGVFADNVGGAFNATARLRSLAGVS
jgi:hypothetical protein